MSQKRFGDAAFRTVAAFMVRWRKLLFTLMVLVIVICLGFADQIKIDNSLEVWFLKDDPTRIAYNEFKKVYGNDEIILAMVDCRHDGMFSQKTLNALLKASKDLEADKDNFRRVLSVGLAPYIGLDDDELIIEDLMTGEVQSATDAARIRQRFMDDPFKKKVLADLTASYAILLIEPVASKNMDVKRPLIIKAVRERLKGFSYRLAGMGVMYDELNQLSIRDGMVFSTISYVVIALLVFLLYRSWVMLTMVVLAMVCGGLGFVGVYGVFSQNFNMVTIVLPTLMMILSISDIAYVYNNYCFNMKRIREDKEKGLAYVLNEVLSPCLFTSLTNTCGFFAIISSPMAVLKGFGFFAGFACMAEYVISMIVAVFVLGFLTPQEDAKIRRPFATIVSRWMKIMPKYSTHIMIFLVISASFAFYGIAMLVVDTYSMGFLNKTNHVRVDSDYVEKVYGNYLPLEIRLLTGEPEGIKQPDFLKRLSKTHDDLEALPEVEKAASIVDVMKKLNQVMSDGTMKTYVTPSSFNAASQLMMLYESDPDNDLIYMTNPPDYSEARLTVRVPMISAAGLRKIEGKVEKILKKNFAGTKISYRFGGYVPLYSRIINYVTQSQVFSFALALFFVFGAIILLFRRIDAILLAIIPNIYPILMTMGIMGWIGLRLDIATVTISAIALGIVVDDTIHELFLYFEPHRSHMTPEEAIVDSLSEAGPAVVSTSLIYALGFLVLAFASIKSVVYFGALLSMTIMFALICEITLLPAIICTFQHYRPWGYGEIRELDNPPSDSSVVSDGDDSASEDQDSDEVSD